MLDEATGKWGIRVNRVELKAIDPPASIQDSMEKQMRADRDKRAAILQAEGQAKAIGTVFGAIHAGNVDPKLLAYQYLQMLPQIAQGQANKLWIVPSELTEALKGIGRAFTPTSTATDAAAPPAAPGAATTDRP